MDSSLNIVELIENNPITKLSHAYNSKLLTKIQNNFSEFEQQLFVSSFYCYLNCHPKNDFVIDLDDVWKWLGFTLKSSAKRTLEQHFIVDNDYTKSLSFKAKQTTHTKGGQNKEIFMLSVKTFKSLCLKAGTKKADEIHEYYIKLEETLHEVISEESDELKLQLENKNIQLEQEKNKNANLNTELLKKDIILDNQVIKSELEKTKLREKTILEQFPPNTQCVYYGLIDNVSTANEPLIKFGNSNNLRSRILQHKETYENFRLVNAFKVGNKCEIETAMKSNPTFSARLRTLSIKTKNYIELLNIEGMTCHEIDMTIKQIIQSIECTPENYKRLLDENSSLRKQLYEQGNTDYSNQVCVLTSENKRLTKENSMLLKKLQKLEQKVVSWKNIATDNEITNEDNNIVVQPPVYTNIINDMKRPSKQKDGKYHIGNTIYDLLMGTREEVWNGVAYKTTGGLIKSDLIINNHGNIVSLNKSVSEKKGNRLEQVNLLKSTFGKGFSEARAKSAEGATGSVETESTT
jgi:phage anti-repressor protein